MHMKMTPPTRAEMVEFFLCQHYPQDEIRTYRALAEEVCQTIRRNSPLPSIEKTLEEVTGGNSPECAQQIWGYLQTQQKKCSLAH